MISEITNSDSIVLCIMCKGEGISRVFDDRYPEEDKVCGHCGGDRVVREIKLTRHYRVGGVKI